MSTLLADREHRVSTVELFFDLVFAFAFTQVTTLLLEHATWGGLGRGLLMICALWWAWASYAWLTNAADAGADPVLAMLLFAAGAQFVAALAVPEAFGGERFVFAVAFFAVLAGFVALYALIGKREADLLAAVARISWPILSGAALIIAAAFTPTWWRPAIWLVALVIGFGGPMLMRLDGWRVFPAHFAERHGLIVIIAIGESLGSIGFGARGTALDARVIVAAILGFLAAASFWLAYFDYASGGISDLLERRSGLARTAFARDVYTYAHLPMVVGIILFAFGMRTTIGHVGSELRLIPALALCCGPALYLFGFVALRWRASRSIGRGRPAAAVGFALLTIAATHMPALAALGLVTLWWAALHAYELIGWREERARRRSTEAQA
ncbi:MAG TPA: low temperature requirement protein A [Gaiellaceae bacterium]